MHKIKIVYLSKTAKEEWHRPKASAFTIPVCSAYLFDDYHGNTYLEKGHENYGAVAPYNFRQ